MHADFQAIEAAMTEGHPGFVANNGRIGFGLADHEAYAPEAGNRSGWSGSRCAGPRAQFTAGAGVTEEELYADELGPDTLPTSPAAARPRPGPGRLPLPAGPPVAVGATSTR